MDFLEQYKKNKLINNLSIIGISLALALAINFTFLNPNFNSQNLKADILQKDSQENKSDISFEKIENNIVLKNNYPISDIKNLNFSLVYNPDNINITEIIPKLNSDIQIIGNTAGIKTVFINYKENFNISKNDTLAIIKYSKINKNTENLNIINANFTNSEGKVFELTNKGISF